MLIQVHVWLETSGTNLEIVKGSPSFLEVTRGMRVWASERVFIPDVSCEIFEVRKSSEMVAGA